MDLSRRQFLQTAAVAAAVVPSVGADRPAKLPTRTLGKTGKSLLAKYHSLPAELTVTPTGTRTAIAIKNVAFTVKVKKAKKAKKKPKKRKKAKKAKKDYR